MAVEPLRGAEWWEVALGGPPMIGGASLLLLEALPTCHEWVWVVRDVCHAGLCCHDTSAIRVMLYLSL